MKTQIGVYATEGRAKEAVTRLKVNPWFVETPSGFDIDEYRLDQDHWTEGYKTV